MGGPTYLRVELDVANLDPATANTGFDLIEIQLTSAYKVTKSPLEKERKYAPLQRRRQGVGGNGG